MNSLEFYKYIFENIPESILICDSSFKVVDVNKSLENLIDFKKEELIGKNCSEFIIPDKTFYLDIPLDTAVERINQGNV